MHSFIRQAEQQAFTSDRDQLSQLLAAIIQKNASGETWDWLNQQSTQTYKTATFNGAFAMMPRKTGRKIVSVATDDANILGNLLPHFTITGWKIDRLCRVWLLLQLDATRQEEYKRRIENLFQAADMNELVALYSSLPLLAYGDMWKLRCAEGIRSNIGDVLEAIICHNPYPAAYLEQSAWNQMVLKAFFTSKPIEQIVGLDERNNPELASILIDYAHERYAAHRAVNPLLWLCVAPYINEANFIDIRKLLSSENRVEREAGALACYDSDYAPAKDLLKQYPDLKERVENSALSWQTIAASAK